MKLVVGLGNPGRKYHATRHNVGFAVLDDLEGRHGTGKRKSQFQGESLEINLAGAKTLLLWPQTFMNLSGASVLAAVDFYKLELNDILVVCDDFNLPLARLRFRAEGSSGGQKGLDNIIRRLGTEAFPRLRIGVGPLPPEFDPADFVLSRFRKDEQFEAALITRRAAEAVGTWVRDGIEICMNQYNRPEAI